MKLGTACTTLERQHAGYPVSLLAHSLACSLLTIVTAKCVVRPVDLTLPGSENSSNCSGVRQNVHFFTPLSCLGRTDLPVQMLLKAKPLWSFIPQNKKRGTFGHRAEKIVLSPFGMDGFEIHASEKILWIHQKLLHCVQFGILTVNTCKVTFYYVAQCVRILCEIREIDHTIFFPFSFLQT